MDERDLPRQLHFERKILAPRNIENIFFTEGKLGEKQYIGLENPHV